MAVIDSALRYGPFDGRVSVYLFGRPLDWSIAGEDQEDVLQRLGEICVDLGVTSVYVPNPSKFNAEISSVAGLTFPIELPESEAIIWRGTYADGVEIPSGRAFWMSSADCISIVTHDPSDGKTIAAHGGRDCLVDRGRINGDEAREYESVVHAIAAQYSKQTLKRLKVFLTCGIAPDHFDHSCDHETYGKPNMRMVLDVLAKWGSHGRVLHGDHFAGKLCLSEIIRAQFLSLGVQAHNIAYDGVDTYSSLGRDGSHRWWSYRRGDGKKRNGVLVVRNW